jgi:hypothetical protein
MKSRSELAATQMPDDEAIVLRKTRLSANSSVRDSHVKCATGNLRRPLSFRN